MEAIGVNYPPLHPFCRCTTIPYFADLGGERAARAADGSSYTVSGDTSYEEWREGLKNQGKSGILNIDIDEFVPCLKDAKTGEILETEVALINDRDLLKGYSEKTGWNVDWHKMPSDRDIYGLYTKRDKELQGLLAIADDPKNKAVYLNWASAAPHNNKLLNKGKQKYIGVGGHLFAIGAEQSIKRGYGGFMFGFAANEKLLHHYIDKFNATYLGLLHPYHFIIEEKGAVGILEKYNFEWREE